VSVSNWLDRQLAGYSVGETNIDGLPSSRPRDVSGRPPRSHIIPDRCPSGLLLDSSDWIEQCSAKGCLPLGATMNVAEWLRQLGLERYEATFRENAVTDELVTSLTAEDLRDLGITAVGHRRRLLDEIAKLRIEPAGNLDAAEPTAVPAADVPQHSPQPAAQRRQVSVMFCDMIESTQLSTQLDPEDLSAVIRRYQSCVAATIARFDGFIARYVGDGVLIYFGYPQAHEDDAERAVRAALALIAEIDRARTSNEGVRVRIGISTGLVVVGESIGSGESWQQTAIGETPNLAARLQALAEPNTVVIAPSTRRLVGDLFEYRDLGAVPI
jgi:class 3 adenylate cyclase